MDIFSYKVRETPSKCPEITNLLQSLLDLLTIEFDLWSIKPVSVTIRHITKCNIALRMMKLFMSEGNYKATYLSMQRYDLSVKDIDKCFKSGNKEITKEMIVNKRNKARRIYRDVMLLIINYIEIEAKKDDDDPIH